MAANHRSDQETAFEEVGAGLANVSRGPDMTSDNAYYRDPIGSCWVNFRQADLLAAGKPDRPCT